MSYKPPYKLVSLSLLQAIYNQLLREYKGNNEERWLFIELYRKIIVATKDAPNEKKARMILMGALTFELEYIKQVEYEGISPEKKGSWTNKLKGGSILYTSIKQLLKINVKNPLPDDQRLIYLNKFFWFMAEHFSTNQTLMMQIEERLVSLKKREMQRLGVYAEGLPALVELRKKIAEILPSYEESRLHPNPIRLKFLKFLNLINETCDELYLNLEKNRSKFGNDFCYLQACNALAGSLLFILLSIEAEYKNYKWFWSPKRSAVFRECLRALHVKSLKKIPGEIRIEWLRGLVLHLQLLKLDPVYYKKIKEKCKEEKITLDTFLSDIEKQINVQKEKNAAPSWTETLAKFLVRGGFGLVAAECTADIVLPVINSTLVVGASGPIGLAVYLAGGALLMTQLGRLISEDLIPKTSSYLFAWVLDKIGGKISDVTRDAATMTFSATREGFQALIGHPNINADDRELICDWIETMLELPARAMSETEKQQIKYLMMTEIPEEKISYTAKVM